MATATSRQGHWFQETKLRQTVWALVRFWHVYEVKVLYFLRKLSCRGTKWVRICRKSRGLSDFGPQRTRGNGNWGTVGSVWSRNPREASQNSIIPRWQSQGQWPGGVEPAAIICYFNLIRWETEESSRPPDPTHFHVWWIGPRAFASSSVGGACHTRGDPTGCRWFIHLWLTIWWV